MNGGRFVGRVGGLGIALGVGVALASAHQAPAWADDGCSADARSASVSQRAGTGSDDESAVSGKASAKPTPRHDRSTGGDGDQSDDNSDAGTGATERPHRTSDADSTGDAESDTDSAAPPHRASVTDDADPAPATHSPKHGREVDGTSETAADTMTASAETGAGPDDVAPQIRALPEDGDIATSAAEQPGSSPAAETDPQPSNAPVGLPMGSAGDVVLTDTAAIGVYSATPNDPATPVEPMELATLAVAARQRTFEPSSATEDADVVVPTLLAAETPDTIATFGFAESTSTLTVPTQPLGEPDSATGVVTGVVTADDPGNGPLSFSLMTGPTNGTAVVDPTTGEYTYTPTRAARLNAGLTTTTDADSFTVAVSDGQQTTNTVVSVSISPLLYIASTSSATGPGPSAVTVGPDGRVYVANTASWSVSVIDTTTGQQIDANPGNWFSKDIPVGPWPGALLLSPDGTKLYVANTGWMTVSVIDTTTYKSIDADPGNWFSNDFLVGFNPSAMVIGDDGRLYVANRGSASVAVIDTTTYKRIDTDPIAWFPNDIAVGAAPSALALRGNLLYVANRDSNTVSVIDTTTYQVVKTLDVGRQPSAMTLGSEGRLYVVNTGGNTVSVIDTATNTVGKSPISVGSAPSSIAFDAVGNRAFVTNADDTVSIIDTTTNTVTYSTAIDIDLSGGHAVALGPNGTVYITDSDDAALRVLAPVTGQVNVQIDLGIGSGAQVALIPGAFGSGDAVAAYLQGALCAAPNVCTSIKYMNTGEFFGPDLAVASMDDGVTNLDAWIRSTPGRKIVMGHSLGSAIIYRWLRQYSDDPTAPPPSELSFITLGSSERSGTGYAYTDPTGMYDYRVDQGFGIPADTPYQVVDGCRKWDGWCYWIPGDDRSAQGQQQLHLSYGNVDLNDPANQVVVKGNVIEVLIPTPSWG